MASFTTARELYQFAITNLLRKEPWFAHFVTTMVYKERTDIPLAAVAFKQGVPMGEIMFHPENFPKLTISEATGLLVHELLHWVYQHPFSPLGGNRLFNIAADMCINSSVLSMGYKLPKGGCTPRSIAEALGVPAPPEKETAMYYYNWLIANIPKVAGMGQGQQKQKGGKGNQQGQGEGDGQDNKGQGQGQQKGKGKGKGKGKQQQDPNGGGGSPQQGDPMAGDLPDPQNGQGKGSGDPLEPFYKEICHNWDEMTPEQQNLARHYIEAKVQSCNAEGSPPGTVAGAVEELIKALKPKVQWQKYLKRFAGMCGGVDVKYNRNFPSKMMLCDINEESGRVRMMPTSRLLIAIDTSGSVSEKMLGQFLGECEAIVHKHNMSCDLMWVDYDVHDVIPFRRHKEGYKAQGRGGTDMTKIFDWLNENSGRKYDGVIVLTDGYTPYPSAVQLRGRKVLWAITEESIVNGFKSGIGQVVHVKIDGAA